MTERELKKISRVDLLEMLLAQSKELEQLHRELDMAKAELANRKIALEESGNIADAALKLNGVFEAAQAAAEQYVENVTEHSRTVEERCRKLEEETEKNCKKMVSEAKAEIATFWDMVREKLKDPLLRENEWQQILKTLEGKPTKGSNIKL